MSRQSRHLLANQNTYVQFRFQSSLRKYEPKPAKKIKFNQVLLHHHHRKICQHSPVPSSHFKKPVTKGKENTFERYSGVKMSEQRHIISSNKTIRLSKQKQLQEISANPNNLQMKIYASLVNISKGDSKGRSDRSQQDVFLNDFSIDGMDQERDDDGDGRFGQIQICNKEGVNELKYQEFYQERQNINQGLNIKEEVKCGNEQIVQNNEEAHQFNEEIQNINKEGQCINEESQNLQKEQQQQKQMLHEQKSISINFQQLSVKQLEEQQLKHQILSPQINVNQHQQNQMLQQNVQIQQPFMLCIPNQSYLPEPVSQVKSVIRQQSCQQSEISSKIVEEHQIDDEMMEKCLAFQGGRIYIDSSGQNFYISVRVFNKLRKQCSSIDNLLDTLITQRPYLQTSRSKLREQLQNYLQNDIL